MLCLGIYKTAVCYHEKQEHTQGETMIAKERIQEVKDKDLVNVCERLGIELQKNGRNYVAICPFHIENKSKFHN